MWFRSLYYFLKSRGSFSLARPCQSLRRRNPPPRFYAEALEDRCLLSFNPIVTYPATNNGGMVAADFNGDGSLDLAFADMNGVSVLQGNNDGTFQTAITSPATAGAGRAVVSADFNGDDKIDLVTLTVDGSTMILMGNGDGTFQAPLPFGFEAHPDLELTAMAVGDLDGNGTIDLVMTHTIYESGEYATVHGQVNVLLGNGDGTFFHHFGTGTFGAHAVSIAITELNGDGNLDLVIGDSDYIGMALLGNGDGTFSHSYPDSAISFGTAGVADFNGDGQIDVATNFIGRFEILSGNGDGTFQIYGQFDSGGDGVFIADFNGDGELDLAATYASGVKISLGYGNGTFAAPLSFAIGVPVYSWNLIAADFNGDGFPDLAFARYSNGISVLINDGDWDGVLPPPPPPPAPKLSIDDVTVTEGNNGTTTAVFTVSLSAPSAETITVAYETTAITATAGSDYQTTSGTLTFAPGETSKTIPVLVNGDRLPEEAELFFVNLGDPTNATILPGVGVGTILDDEPSILINDVAQNEGRSGTTSFAFTVSLSAAYDAPWSVDYTTVDDTATAGSDYHAVSGTLNFAPGETSKTITVLVNGDRLTEPNETFLVRLSNPDIASVWYGGGFGTILNDDGGKGGGKGGKNKLSSSSTLRQTTLTSDSEPVLLTDTASDFDDVRTAESDPLSNTTSAYRDVGNVVERFHRKSPPIRLSPALVPNDGSDGPVIDTQWPRGDSRSIDAIWSDLELWDDLLS